MAKLFGLDIAKIINDAIGSAGGVRPLTLTKFVGGSATVGALTAGTNDSPAESAGQGFVESSSHREAGTLVDGTTAIVSILGASLPEGVKPAANDRVLLDDVEYELLAVETDPAEALFECQAAG